MPEILRNALHGITQHMLTRALRSLERDGLISRCDYPEKVPRVVCTATDAGEKMMPLWS
ncbi:winged helix-turn-helix transcriptional regulator [Pantoea dispersa]|uniref:winged helix-turn-helix transcriptional regulator n=1 Tax=Pantoea dispersa TaxID=59814 RepID=UPI003AEF9B9F